MNVGPIPLVEVDLDARLLPVWAEAWPVNEWDLETVAPFLRLAYYVGYRDALTEKRRGALLRDHRQPVPHRAR